MQCTPGTQRLTASVAAQRLKQPRLQLGRWQARSGPHAARGDDARGLGRAAQRACCASALRRALDPVHLWLMHFGGRQHIIDLRADLSDVVTQLEAVEHVALKDSTGLLE